MALAPFTVEDQAATGAQPRGKRPEGACPLPSSGQLGWTSFGSWLRTIGPGVVPSEVVVAIALRDALPHFPAHSSPAPDTTKFIQDRLDLSNTQARFEFK